MPRRRQRALRPMSDLGAVPSRLDGGMMLGVLALSLAHSPRLGAAGIALTVALVAPLVWRHRAPVLTFSVIWTVAAAQWLVTGAVFADSALLIGFYTVATSSGLRRTVTAGAALELAIVLAASSTASSADAWIRAFVGLSGLVTAAGLIGTNVRHRRQIVAGLRERAERLEHEREQEVQLATATERARIAREMHDVVAHNLSVMVALCDGAAYQVHDDPDRVGAALEQASRTGRQALAEMRQLLGVLRDPPAGLELAPQPGIGQVPELVEQVRAAGVPASFTLTGELTGGPPGIELAVYRIVQEALTNTLKHAGPGTRATVSLTGTDHSIEVEVRDTGNAPHRPSRDGTGLRGMRERAALYGGTLEAGPCELGGWRVHARLAVPVDELAGAR